ncbi:MAG: zinc-binding dehydrogenase [Devosia sp.]|nr:zinc-binding dehydrogenase [Devosia sp.]
MALPKEMATIQVRTPGGPEVLRHLTLDLPPLGPGEVMIRVAGAGINAPDVQQRRGRYDPPPGASPILGLEVSGEIAACGEGTSRYAVGDKVVALCNGGGYAEYVAVPEGQVLPLPTGFNLLAGAALPETYFTIQQTLVMRAGLAEGMFVLIHGGAGGIGGAAITLSRLHGARPIAIVSSAEKAAYATSLGAEAVIDRSREDFVARTRELTDGHGADRIVDIVGAQTLGHNLDAAAIEAVIVQLATLAGPRAEINAGLIVSKRISIMGSTLRPQPRDVKAAIAASLSQQVWPALGDGRIHPPEIRYFRLDDVVAAHKAMERREHFGKIVLVTPFGVPFAPTGEA